MSALPLNLGAAMRAFTSPAQTFAYERESYQLPTGIRSNRVKPGTRRVLAATILQMDRQELALMVSGDVVEGGISILTSDTLHYNTSRDNAIGGDGLQSFVEYNNFVYRVVGTGNITGNANFEAYFAVRYQGSGADQN